MATTVTDEEGMDGIVSAEKHALQEQKKRLRLSCAKSDIDLDELNNWSLVNHHRAIYYLLSCVAGIEVWCTGKTTKRNLEQRLLESYCR